MKMYIPACGFHIKLVSDWTFGTYFEGRNSDMLKALGNNDNVGDWRVLQAKRGQAIETTLPAGTVLVVDRVYIRATSKTATSDATDYDSITFRVKRSPRKDFEKIRFWAKLSDVNKIEFDLPSEAEFPSTKDELRSAKSMKKVAVAKLRKLMTRMYITSEGKMTNHEPELANVSLSNALADYDLLECDAELAELHKHVKSRWFGDGTLNRIISPPSNLGPYIGYIFGGEDPWDTAWPATYVGPGTYRRVNAPVTGKKIHRFYAGEAKGVLRGLVKIDIAGRLWIDFHMNDDETEVSDIRLGKD